MKKFLNLLFILFLLIPISIKAEAIDINSTNAVMINLNNNEIIYEKGKDDVIKIASMQKVMTSLIAIEKIDNLDEEFTLPSGIFDGLDPDLAVVGFSSGDRVTYNDLLYATLLKSGADAAYALGMEVSGSEEEYVKLMNDKVKELGLKNTVYKNTSGLDAEGQYSTAYDMAIVLKYAMKNKKFREIVSTPEYTTTNGEYTFSGPAKKAKGMDMPYYVGGKTGFTDEAGLCLASYASFNDIDYVLVTAGANQDLKDQNFIDQKTLFDYFMNNFSFQKIVKKGDKIKTIKTLYDDEVELNASRDVTLYLNNSVFQKDIKHIYEGKEKLDRDIKRGDKIGKYIVKYNDTVLYEEDVLSPITVTFKLKTPYKIAILVLVGWFILHLIVRDIRRQRRKRRRRRRR